MGKGGRGEDVALERVFAQGEQEEVPPLVVGPGGEIQTKRHEGPNVLDGDGLGVEVEEGHNFVEEEDVAKGLVIATSRATTIDRRSGSSGAFLGARSSARQARLAIASQSFFCGGASCSAARARGRAASWRTRAASASARRRASTAASTAAWSAVAARSRLAVAAVASAVAAIALAAGEGERARP